MVASVVLLLYIFWKVLNILQSLCGLDDIQPDWRCIGTRDNFDISRPSAITCPVASGTDHNYLAVRSVGKTGPGGGGAGAAEEGEASAAGGECADLATKCTSEVDCIQDEAFGKIG